MIALLVYYVAVCRAPPVLFDDVYPRLTRNLSVERTRSS